MSAAGIIFSNLHDSDIPELTRLRTMAAVPFMCRYRLVDFPLSNMVNSDITNVSVITHYNYHSLMDHIGSGKDWDLARRSGGVKILPPFITAYANTTNTLYTTRLEALRNVNYSISRITDDYIVMSDCDAICNMDFRELINDHAAHSADLTVAVKRRQIEPEDDSRCLILDAAEDGQVTDSYMNSPLVRGMKNVDLNIMVISRGFLATVLADSIAHSYTSFSRDVIARYIGKRNIRVFSYDGYFATMASFAEYFAHSMEILGSDDFRDELFGNKNRPVFTKIHNSVPTRYSGSCSVRGSYIADGCCIEGTVENSILFRNVKVGRNSVVKNSILFQDTFVGERVSLNCVVSDKDTTIKYGRVLSGHDTLPYYISKGMLV